MEISRESSINGINNRHSFPRNNNHVINVQQTNGLNRVKSLSFTSSSPTSLAFVNRAFEPDGDVSIGGINTSINDVTDEEKQTLRTILRAIFSWESVKNVLSYIVWFLCLIATILLPFALMIMSFVYFKSCPSLPQMPIWLMISCLSLSLANVINLTYIYLPEKHKKFLEEEKGIKEEYQQIFISALNIFFNTIFLISLIVLSLYIMIRPKPCFDTFGDGLNNETIEAVPAQEAGNQTRSYCHPVLYQTSAILVKSTLVFGSFILFLLIIGGGLRFYFKKQKEAREADSSHGNGSCNSNQQNTAPVNEFYERRRNSLSAQRYKQQQEEQRQQPQGHQRPHHQSLKVNSTTGRRGHIKWLN